MRLTPHSRRRLRMKSATSSAMKPLPFGSADLAAQAVKLENVRPVVVGGGVAPLAFLVQARWIELRVEHPLLVPERAGEVGAVRREDRRAAAAHQLVAVGKPDVSRVARGSLEDAAREDEGARLAGDVADRVVPLLG